MRGNDKQKQKNMGKMPMLRMDETSKPRINTASSRVIQASDDIVVANAATTAPGCFCFENSYFEFVSIFVFRICFKLGR